MYEIPKPDSGNHFDDVGRFHEKFQLENTTFYPPGPREPHEEVLDFRLKFLEEELQEFREGMDEMDHAQMFDALIDLVYVALGTAHFLGYPWREGWNLVQAANMNKVRAQADASDSKRGSSFDVVKPEGWQPPDIQGLLEKYGW